MSDPDHTSGTVVEEETVTDEAIETRWLVDRGRTTAYGDDSDDAADDAGDDADDAADDAGDDSDDASDAGDAADDAGDDSSGSDA